MISVVVIGARGYTGAELLPLLYRHPEFEIDPNDSRIFAAFTNAARR